MVSHTNLDGSSSRPINTEQDNNGNIDAIITTVYDATLEYTLTDIIPNSKGVIYISQGTTCDGEINYDPYWNSDVVESNPWFGEEAEAEASTNNITNSYTSNAVGEANGLFAFNDGHDHDDHYEHAVIVLDMVTNELVACGVLMTEIPFQPVDPIVNDNDNSSSPSSMIPTEEPSSSPSFIPSKIPSSSAAPSHSTYTPLIALMHTYTDYYDVNVDGNTTDNNTDEHNLSVNVQGQVQVSYSNGTVDSNTSLVKAATLTYEVTGLFNLPLKCSNVNGCGLFIATGTTCDDVAMVGGPYWNANDLLENPWTAHSYVANEATGVASGAFDFYNGYSHDDNYGHAVVMLDDSGVRVACGVLLTEIPFQPVVVPEDPDEVPSSGVVPSITSAMPLSSTSSRPSNRPSGEDIEDEGKGVNVSSDSSRVPTASPVVSSAIRAIGSLSTTGVCSMVTLWFISAM